MSIEWEPAYFKTNVLIKNIIGKELINDDNVAVMELIKNSYDAGAKRVDIEFINLFNDSENNIKNIEDTTRNTSKIIIKDDGNGMSKDDVLYKWLNIAYSSKKIEHTQNQRYQAGNKGVGRFSCDRLGEYLNLYTKKNNEQIIHLQISWKDFELLNQINTQIQDIPVKIRELSTQEFNDTTSGYYKNFSNGTILEIIKLNSIWAEIENLLDVQKIKLLKLKNNIERLINPNQSYEQNSFKVFIKADDLKEDKNIAYSSRVTGEIKNQIFSELDFKTTFIESLITEDGSKIITELKDKDKTIFRLIEKNNEFPLLKNIKIRLYYLNPYAKAYFKRRTGIHSVDFGSVFLFINGFRISPYGDRDNDSLGLEVRKNQGRSRYFSNREILGRIEIQDFTNTFQVISSREGIVNNNAYKQLISDFDKKTNKYSGYFYKTIKRLEKYVVDGLSWDSLPEDMDERTLEKEVQKEYWNESNEKYLTDKQSKLNNSSEVIYSILGIKSKEVIDLYINEELIESLIEENLDKTNEKLQKFIKNYAALPSNVIDIKTKQALNKLTRSLKGNVSVPDEITKEFENIQREKRKVEEELKVQQKSQQELYKLLRKKVRNDRKKAKQEKEKLEKELEEVKKDKVKKEEQVLFLKSIQPVDKTELIKLQHHIGLYAETIEDTILDFKLLLNDGEVSKDEIINYLTDISLEAQKILAINKYATKAKFLSKSQSIKVDIVQFIQEYIENIYRINANKDLTVHVNKNDISHVCKFEPLIITIIIDNLLNNSKKANAKNVTISFLENEFLILEYIDDGKGLDSSISNPDDIFDIGITTTDGSGLGLHHIKESLYKMKKSTIDVEEMSNGIKFIIRLNI